MKWTVFFISDGTGITAETLGHSLLSQFEQVEFEQITLPYVDTEAKAHETIAQINAVAQQSGQKPLVFATLVNPTIRHVIQTCDGVLMDFFNTFIGQLEEAMQLKSSHHVGRTHGMLNYEKYKSRIDAVNYALATDDGMNIKNFDKADIILIGVSRCGKTPTCLYLALQFGIYPANYPFTEDDMDKMLLPNFLAIHREKLIGLTIDPKRLQSIRWERRPDSTYASHSQCQKEISKMEILFKQEKIPFLDATMHSIEELATSILATTGLKRRLF
jgi:[pyruvate, water dikinase]-phosphate phosphotransferase / [pyruvate, water dikinase] kinase